MSSFAVRRRSTTSAAQFSAEEFVNNLLSEGVKKACDSTNTKFTSNFGLPDFYDENKFKRGQMFYHKYKFALFFGKLLGLVAVLAVPTILKILMFTRMSSDSLSSYRRYLATIFHMNLWYNSDFKPGSELWQSLQEVRRKHNSASKRSFCSGANRITQMEMALTQFGFMGFALSRPQQIGLHCDADNEDDLKCFVHLWAVIGHLMGIEKTYNICRESLEETRAICNELIAQVFRPRLENQTDDFVQMSHTMIDSLTTMQPFLDPRVFNLRLMELVNVSATLQTARFDELTSAQRRRKRFVEFIMWSYKFTILRLYHNIVLVISIWLIHHFPFLAIKRFGRENSYVTILNNNGGGNDVGLSNAGRYEQG